MQSLPGTTIPTLLINDLNGQAPPIALVLDDYDPILLDTRQ
jgi:ATP/maltotriose-dependent transcriptional regulator MalT